MNETDNWPFIQAKHFEHGAPGRKVDLIVLHDMEAPEGPLTAENVAKWFAGQPDHPRPGAGEGPSSAHLAIDNNSIVQCVWDSDVAYAAPGANRNGIQIELAGYIRQTRAEWLDEYSRAVIENAARAVMQYCRKYMVPPKRLTDGELAIGKRGIIGHDQASRVFKKSDHRDPGPNFPWDVFLDRLHYHILRCGQ